MFAAYYSLLILFYGAFLVVPRNRLFRRPAMTFYALFNALYSSSMLTIGAIIYMRASFLSEVYCAASIWLFLWSSLMQPIVVFRTLQLDSQYWQGLHPVQLGLVHEEQVTHA